MNVGVPFSTLNYTCMSCILPGKFRIDFYHFFSHLCVYFFRDIDRTLFKRLASIDIFG